MINDVSESVSLFLHIWLRRINIRHGGSSDRDLRRHLVFLSDRSLLEWSFSYETTANCVAAKDREGFDHDLLSLFIFGSIEVLELALRWCVERKQVSLTLLLYDGFLEAFSRWDTSREPEIVLFIELGRVRELILLS